MYGRAIHYQHQGQDGRAIKDVAPIFRITFTDGSYLEIEAVAPTIFGISAKRKCDGSIHHPDTVEIWYGDRKVEVLPRLRGRSKHRIDYRHIIDWLVRKPGAFENYRYRADLFPTSWFRLAYDALREEQGPKRGAQEYLAILLLAARRGEDRVEGALRFLLGSQQTLNAEETARLTEDNAPAPLTTIAIDPVSLTIFDDLLTMADTAA